MLASVRAARPDWHLELVAPADGPLLAEAVTVGVSGSIVAQCGRLARVGEPGVASNWSLLQLRGVMSAIPPLADYGRRLRSALRTLAPDVVHTHGMKAHLLAAWIAPRTARVIWHLHDYIGRRPRSASVLRGSLRRCAVVMANSASVAEDARRTLDARVPVVPVLNAVDLERFRPDGRRRPLGDGALGAVSASSPLRVGLVGTFGRWKGHATFIDALARLSPELRVEGVIVGGPVYRTDSSQFSFDELGDHARQRGVAGRLTFTGFVRDVETVLRSLDVVIHASTEPEPFGLVIAEAMACGRPVVVADAGGARELVTPVSTHSYIGPSTRRRSLRASKCSPPTPTCGGASAPKRAVRPCGGSTGRVSPPRSSLSTSASCRGGGAREGSARLQRQSVRWRRGDAARSCPRAGQGHGCGP